MFCRQLLINKWFNGCQGSLVLLIEVCMKPIFLLMTWFGVISRLCFPHFITAAVSTPTHSVCLQKHQVYNLGLEPSVPGSGTFEYSLTKGSI